MLFLDKYFLKTVDVAKKHMVFVFSQMDWKIPSKSGAVKSPIGLLSEDMIRTMSKVYIIVKIFEVIIILLFTKQNCVTW